jgi:arylsulfatase A-like enzyme
MATPQESKNMNQPSRSQPNVVILIADQLARRWLGCYGDPDAVTPNIDALAADGVRFANSCSSYPVCVPFRFTWMTGETAHSRRVPAIEWAMSEREITLADEFNAAGYQTAYVGKWHLDGGHGRLGSARQVNLTPVPRHQQGRWQKWYGFELRNGPHDTWYFEDDDPMPRRVPGYQTDGLYDLGMNWMKNVRNPDRPFCLVVSTEPPHEPFEPPAELGKLWSEREVALPGSCRPKNDAERAYFTDLRRKYLAMVQNLDDNVGRMRRFLRDNRLEENTIVVLMSDHGELLGCHNLIYKHHPYEESVGIPLIVCDPKNPNNGAVLPLPTNTEDLFPTLLGLAGIKPRATTLTGADLTPNIRGEAGAPEREMTLLEFVAELRPEYDYHDKMWRAVRSKRHKYVVLGNNRECAPWRFFDLEHDPEEQVNQLDNPDYAEEIKRHHRFMAAEMLRTKDIFMLPPLFGCDGVNYIDQTILG